MIKLTDARSRSDMTQRKCICHHHIQKNNE